MTSLSSTLNIVIFAFLLVLALLWFFLPFAVFGTKDKLEELIKEVKKTNDLLNIKNKDDNSEISDQ